MLLQNALLSFLLILSHSTCTPSPYQNPLAPPSANYKLPSVHESAILARRILNLTTIGTLATVFQPETVFRSHNHHNDPPSLHSNPSSGHDVSAKYISDPPSNLVSSPIGLMEYLAPCPPKAHQPTILAVTIANTIHNSLHGSNVSLSLRWHVPPNAPPTKNPFLYSPANLPRFSIQGYIEPIPEDEVEAYAVKECFLDRHSEVIWTPGSDIHESWWARVVVTGVYWFGGFGDRARIGWLPMSEWEGVTEEEIEKARLPGEEGFVPPDWVDDDAHTTEL